MSGVEGGPVRSMQATMWAARRRGFFQGLAACLGTAAVAVAATWALGVWTPGTVVAVAVPGMTAGPTTGTATTPAGTVVTATHPGQEGFVDATATVTPGSTVVAEDGLTVTCADVRRVDTPPDASSVDGPTTDQAVTARCTLGSTTSTVLTAGASLYVDLVHDGTRLDALVVDGPGTDLPHAVVPGHPVQVTLWAEAPARGTAEVQVERFDGVAWEVQDR